MYRAEITLAEYVMDANRDEFASEYGIKSETGTNGELLVSVASGPVRAGEQPGAVITYADGVWQRVKLWED